MVVISIRYFHSTKMTRQDGVSHMEFFASKLDATEDKPRGLIHFMDEHRNGTYREIDALVTGLDRIGL